MKTIIFFIMVSFSLSLYAQSQTVWEYVDSKLEKKKFEQWSLSSWFYQKEKMRLQDQWLSMNLGGDEIFFEFYADYAGVSFDADTANNLNEISKGHSTEVGAYVGFLGLVARFEDYDKIYSQSEGALSLRIIGSSLQSTHLIFSYGSRKFSGDNDLDEQFTQSFYGGDISLYLVPFFGFDGRYRNYNKAENSAHTAEMESTRSQWGAFIDFAFLRLFIYQFEENLKFTPISTGTTEERQIKGTGTGLRLYF